MHTAFGEIISATLSGPELRLVRSVLWRRIPLDCKQNKTTHNTLNPSIHTHIHHRCGRRISAEAKKKKIILRSQSTFPSQPRRAGLAPPLPKKKIEEREINQTYALWLTLFFFFSAENVFLHAALCMQLAASTHCSTNWNLACG